MRHCRSIVRLRIDFFRIGQNKFNNQGLTHFPFSRVVGLLRRDRDDPDEKFVNMIKVDQWELPILEAVYSSSIQ